MWHLRNYRTSGSRRSRCIARLGPWAVALTALLLGASVARADRFPTNPVTGLSDALKADREPRGAPAIEYRKKLLREKIARLRSLGEVARALLLQDWRLDSLEADVRQADEEVWGELAKRFRDGVKAYLERGGEMEKRAVADLLGETAVNARSSASKAILARDLLKSFDKDLASLMKNATEPRTRASAARALSELNPKPEVATEALASLLKPENDVIERRAAARALGNMIGILGQTQKKAQGDRTAAENLPALILKLGELAVPVAIKGLSDPDPEVRRLSVEAIQYVAVTGADLIVIPAFLEFPPEGRPATEEERTRMEDYKNRVEAERRGMVPLAKALENASSGQGQDGSARGARLAQLVNDPDPAVRLLTRQTLEDVGYLRERLLQRASTVPTIPPPTKEEKELEALGAVRKRQAALVVAVVAQVPAAGDPQQLLLRGLVGARSELAAGLMDPNPQSRLAAVEALEMMGAEAQPIAPALVRSLADPDRFVRWAAARTLGKLPPSKEAVPALARLLQDPDLDLQLTAAAALERYGPAAASAVGDLTAATRRGDAESRIGAMHALEGIGTDSTPALPAITAALEDDNSRVRQTAAEVLARFGPLARESAPALRRALSDPVGEVRRAASDALLAILPPTQLK